MKKKKYFIAKHTEIILNSKDEKLIKEFKKFLKYNRLQEEKPKLWNSSKKHSRKRI